MPEPYDRTLGVTVQREELHAAMIALEDAAASAATSREAAWQAQMRAALEQVDAAFDVHVHFTESPGGLYSEILSTSPRLAHALTAVRDEHPVIARSIEDLHAALRSSECEHAEGVAQCRELCGRTLGLLVRHRQRGADLTYSAFEHEIGGNG